MKKRRTLALLMAGILTASALSIGASAEEAEFTPQTGIEQQEETASEKREKKSADKTSEDGTVKEKKAKKSTDSAEDGTVTEKKVKKSSDSASETELSQKKHGKKASG